MEYTEIKITLPTSANEDTKGLYMSDLGDMGCDSFSEERNFLMAYIPSALYQQNKAEITDYLSTLTGCKSDINIIADKNWNELWESNFSTITVNEKCAVRAPFHEPTGFETEIIIMPRMAFGTGHHQTTQLMIDDILDMNLSGRKGLDMGCGTGVLAIAALIKGATHMDAIDIDEWAYDNVMENAAHNHVESKINAYWGDASLLENGLLSDKQYDFIFANINRNILLRDMNIYVSHLKKGGEILFSGFLEDDVQMMKNRAFELGLKYAKTGSRDKWHMLKFVKN